MTYRRRYAQRGSVAPMFLGILGSLVVLIEAGSLGGDVVRAHLRAHSEAESLARLAAEDIDERAYHTTGNVVLDVATAESDATRHASTLPVPVQVVDVQQQNDPVLGPTVRVTVLLQQTLVGGFAPVTIYETAAARLARG